MSGVSEAMTPGALPARRTRRVPAMTKAHAPDIVVAFVENAEQYWPDPHV